MRDVAAAAAGDLLRALARRRGGAVEHHGHHHDQHARHEGGADVVDAQAGEDGLAEARAVDEGRQGGHRERGQRRLVEADDDGLARHRELHLEQPLPVGLPGRVGGLDGRGRHLPDPEAGDPDEGRERVEDRAHDGRADTDAEEQHDRQEVDEGRHRLHQVEDDGDHLVGPRAGADQDRQRHPDDHDDGDRDAGDDQQVERVLPEAEDAEGEEGEADQHRDAPAGDHEADVRRDRDDAEPADLRHRSRRVGHHDHPLHPLEGAAEQVGDRVGELHDRVGVAAREQRRC